MLKEPLDFAPLFLNTIPAGFPSPAEDYIESQLDLNELIVKHPTATFFVKVEGESMSGASIHSGDMLVVDRSLEAKNGRIIVAKVDGEFTVKRLVVGEGGTVLQSENPLYPSLAINPESDFEVWGVVTYVIHKAS